MSTPLHPYICMLMHFSQPMEALKPKCTYNPVLQHFYQAVQKRALQPEAPVPPLDPVIQKCKV